MLGGFHKSGRYKAVIDALIAASSSGGGTVLESAVFVDPNGNDSTGDGTMGNPYLTLGQGVTAAEALISGGAASATIFLMPGEYTEAGGLTADGNISIVGLGGHREDVKVTMGSTLKIQQTAADLHTAVRNIYFTTSASARLLWIYNNSSAEIFAEVSNCRFEYTGGGAPSSQGGVEINGNNNDEYVQIDFRDNQITFRGSGHGVWLRMGNAAANSYIKAINNHILVDSNIGIGSYCMFIELDNFTNTDPIFAEVNGLDVVFDGGVAGNSILNIIGTTSEDNYAVINNVRCENGTAYNGIRLDSLEYVWMTNCYMTGAGAGGQGVYYFRSLSGLNMSNCTALVGTGSQALFVENGTAPDSPFLINNCNFEHTAASTLSSSYMTQLRALTDIVFSDCRFIAKNLAYIGIFNFNRDGTNNESAEFQNCYFEAPNAATSALYVNHTSWAGTIIVGAGCRFDTGDAWLEVNDANASGNIYDDGAILVDDTPDADGTDIAVVNFVRRGAKKHRFNSAPHKVIQSVSFTATPTFSAAYAMQYMELTGNVTGITLAEDGAGVDIGTEFDVLMYQDNAGSHTVAGWPATVDWGTPGAPTMPSAADKGMHLRFTYWGGSVPFAGRLLTTGVSNTLVE